MLRQPHSPFDPRTRLTKLARGGDGLKLVSLNREFCVVDRGIRLLRLSCDSSSEPSERCMYELGLCIACGIWECGVVLFASKPWYRVGCCRGINRFVTLKCTALMVSSTFGCLPLFLHKAPRYSCSRQMADRRGRCGGVSWGDCCERINGCSKPPCMLGVSTESRLSCLCCPSTPPSFCMSRLLSVQLCV